MSTGNTSEAQARHAAGSARGAVAVNTPEKGRKGRKVSPWNRGPMCDGQKAMASFKRYHQQGKING